MHEQYIYICVWGGVNIIMNNHNVLILNEKYDKTTDASAGIEVNALWVVII